MNADQKLLRWVALCGACVLLVVIAVPVAAYVVAYPKALKYVDARIAAVEAKVENSKAPPPPTESAKPDFSAVNTKIDTANAATAAQIQKTLTQIASLETKIETINTRLSQIEKTAARSASLDAIKADIGGLANAQAALSSTVAKLGDRLPDKAQPDAASGELAVIYVSTPQSQPAGAIAPMSVSYKKIGSLDDDGQAKAIAEKLKQIIKTRKNCAISVEGYADTIGGDDQNLSVSKRRATRVAAKLKAVFAGQNIPINEMGWGERRLKVWTDDDTDYTANRRVDVNVTCKD